MHTETEPLAHPACRVGQALYHTKFRKEGRVAGVIGCKRGGGGGRGAWSDEEATGPPTFLVKNAFIRSPKRIKWNKFVEG